MTELYILGGVISFCFGIYVVRCLTENEPDFEERLWTGSFGLFASLMLCSVWPVVMAALVLLYVIGVIRRQDIEKYKKGLTK